MTTHLAGLDVAHVGGADEIERAGLRADDPGVAETAERERAEAVRIARGDQAILGEEREREGAGAAGAIDSTSASSNAPACDRAYRCSDTSVSLLVWKIEPCSHQLVAQSRWR